MQKRGTYLSGVYRHIRWLWKQGLSRQEIGISLAVSRKSAGRALINLGARPEKYNRNFFSKLTRRQRSILIGSLLGDGCLGDYNVGSSGPSLKFCHGIAQRAYCEWKISEFGALFRRQKLIPFDNGVSIEVGGASRPHPVFQPWYDLFYSRASNQCRGRRIGKKQVTITALNYVDALALAIWFMDDGTGEKHDHARTALVLYLGAMTSREYKLIQDWFLAHGYPCTLGKGSGNCRRLRFSAEASFCLASRMRLHFHPTMLYKLEGIAHVGAREEAKRKTQLRDYVKAHPEVISGDRNWKRKNPGKIPRGSKAPNSKLTERDVLQIRTAAKSGYALAADYGVSKSLIYAILNREVWTHI